MGNTLEVIIEDAKSAARFSGTATTIVRTFSCQEHVELWVREFRNQLERLGRSTDFRRRTIIKAGVREMRVTRLS